MEASGKAWENHLTMTKTDSAATARQAARKSQSERFRRCVIPSYDSGESSRGAQFASNTPHPAFGHPLPASRGEGQVGKGGPHIVSHLPLAPRERGEGPRSGGEGSLHANCCSAFSIRLMPSAASSIERFSGGRKRTELCPEE